MFRITLLALLLLGTGLAAPAAAQPVPGTETAPVLAAGDMVRIVVWRNSELSGDFPVAMDGTLQHPLYRDVRVGGVALGEVESQVRSFLGKYQADPQFMMEPLFRVFVGGVNLQRAGVYHLPPYTTVADAIRAAGGSTAPARDLRVRLIRGESANLVALTEGATPLLSERVRSGDQIIMERRPSLLANVISPAAAVSTGLWSIYSILHAVGLF